MLAPVSLLLELVEWELSGSALGVAHVESWGISDKLPSSSLWRGQLRSWLQLKRAPLSTHQWRRSASWMLRGACDVTGLPCSEEILACIGDGNFAALFYSWLLQEFPHLPEETVARSKTQEEWRMHLFLSPHMGKPLKRIQPDSWPLRCSVTAGWILFFFLFFFSHKEKEMFSTSWAHVKFMA